MRLVDFIKRAPLLDIPYLINQYNKARIYNDASYRLPRAHSPANAVRIPPGLSTPGTGLHYNYMQWYIVKYGLDKKLIVSGENSLESVTTRFSAVKDRALVPFFPQSYRESKCLRLSQSQIGWRDSAYTPWLYRVRLPFPTPNYMYTIKLYKEDSTAEIGFKVDEIDTVVKNYLPVKSPKVVIEAPSEVGDMGTLELHMETIPDGWIMGEYIVSEVYPRYWSGYGAMDWQQRDPTDNQRIAYYHAVTFIENRSFSGGYIVSIIDAQQGLYKVNFRGKEEQAKAVDFATYKVGDFVLLLWHYDSSQGEIKDWTGIVQEEELKLRIIKRQPA